MKKNSYLALIFLTISCSNEPDIKIMCECYSEKSKRKYTNSEGKYIQEPTCSSVITGLINEQDNKFLIKKDNWYLNFFDYENQIESVSWRETEILASGKDTMGDDVIFVLDRIDLKSRLITDVFFETPTAMNTVSKTHVQNYQCKVVEGI